MVEGARTREIYRRHLLVYGNMLNIFRGYVGYPWIYTIPRQLLPLRAARYFIVHRSLGKREKWLIRPRDFFYFATCHPTFVK